MTEFFRRIFKGSGVAPPDLCMQSFGKHFEGAINVEWFRNGKLFEAVFYRNNLEHIALFLDSGSLVEYRQNLRPEFLPSAILEIISSRGEIMNSVLKNKGNTIEYEIIIRDDRSGRYQVNLSETGDIMEEKLL